MPQSKYRNAEELYEEQRRQRDSKPKSSGTFQSEPISNLVAASEKARRLKSRQVGSGKSELASGRKKSLAALYGE